MAQATQVRNLGAGNTGVKAEDQQKNKTLQ